MWAAPDALDAATRSYAKRGISVGVVMIKCPATGHAISTGIEANRDGFRQRPVFFARTLCAICRSTHEWFAREAWVEEPSVEISIHSTPRNE